MAKKKQTRAEWEAERRVRIKQIITDGIMSAGLPETRKRAFLAALETVSARIEKEETQALLVRLERKIARRRNSSAGSATGLTESSTTR